MDAVTQSEPQEPPSAEVIDLAAYRTARTGRPDAPAEEPLDPYPWAYTFRAPERR